MTDASLVELTTEIVAAYVGNNAVQAADLPEVIRTIHAALKGVETGASAPEATAPQTPAVSIKKSVTPDWIISLEDGRKFKSMKRHLSIRGMTPDQYRAKWGLAKDYPMVAPNYAAARSQLAKSMGLGQGGRQPAKAAPAVAKPRGRPKKNPA
jgi:predicted transcriptional regulator